MKLRKLFMFMILVVFAMGVAWRHLNATPPLNISFTPIGRATVPAFDVKRKEKEIDCRIDLTSNQPIDVATQVVTFAPGGYSGWHTHPGPVFFTVTQGTLTVYEGDDPTCSPHVFIAGTGAVEAATWAVGPVVAGPTLCLRAFVSLCLTSIKAVFR